MHYAVSRGVGGVNQYYRKPLMSTCFLLLSSTLKKPVYTRKQRKGRQSCWRSREMRSQGSNNNTKRRKCVWRKLTALRLRNLAKTLKSRLELSYSCPFEAMMPDLLSDQTFLFC